MPANLISRLVLAATLAWTQVLQLGPYVAGGILLAVLLGQLHLPRPALAFLVASSLLNPQLFVVMAGGLGLRLALAHVAGLLLLSLPVGLVARLGVPFYACGGGAVPIIAGLLAQGMSPGAALAFFLAGPATRLTALAALGTLLNRQALIAYVAYVVAGAAVVRTMLNLVLGA